jgi:cyclopropane fatty-acyl-phospholipid synthase-like methyltransferase
MPDVYASIESADEAIQERLAEVLELRAADAAQQAMLEDYLGDLPLPDGARVLEVGCGTGAVALTLVDRGADTLVAAGRLGAPAAEALKAEARRRVGAGEFFGHIAYASLIARRP